MRVLLWLFSAGFLAINIHALLALAWIVSEPRAPASPDLDARRDEPGRAVGHPFHPGGAVSARDAS
jgi:hypothetical protein